MSGTPRWSFVRKVGNERYDFTVNPNKHGNFMPVRDHTWNVGATGAVSGLRKGKTPHPSSFSGVVRSEEQFLAFMLWLRRRERIWLDTDLGQRLDIRLLTFKPQQEGHSARALTPWRHTYDMDILIFDISEGPA